MLRFDLARARQWAALMVVIQVFMGVGMALIYGFFYPRVSHQTALYITTATPTLALIPLGFVLVPAGVGQQRLEGTFDFTWSLPVPGALRRSPRSCCSRCCRCPERCWPWWCRRGATG